jgi:alpha-galactosidase
MLTRPLRSFSFVLPAAFVLFLIGCTEKAPLLTDVYDARIEGREVLTPAPPASPRINTPTVYGARPGRPIIFRIPTSGQRPIRFEAEGLPESIQLDPETGILTGTSPKKKGSYRVHFTARNPEGEDKAEWTLVVGEQIALTPPMGWNHWYTHYHLITDKKIRAAADAMVASGMADAGYQYVSIDDCWMRIDPAYVKQTMSKERKTASTGLDIPMKSGTTRDENGKILPAHDFPDMKALTDHIHSYGLKAGIYTSPGPRTCQDFEGSYQHEEQDARTFAEWGFDLLKYDWCRYLKIFMALPKEQQTVAERKKPYYQMGPILARQERDILFNICQYGRFAVWEWGADAGGHSWRTGGDIGHTLDKGGVYRLAKKTLGIREYNRPGAWNDPDYLILGMWASPYDKSAPISPVPLSPNEQYSYMSLWCLMACPLFFSGDMAAVDDFTHNLLCNPEMIAVNQDSLGLCAETIRMDEEAWVLKKELADGSVVVGFFDVANDGDREIRIDWTSLKIEGDQLVRDLWRQKDLGLARESLSVHVGPYGCAVFLLKTIGR